MIVVLEEVLPWPQFGTVESKGIHFLNKLVIVDPLPFLQILDPFLAPSADCQCVCHVNGGIVVLAHLEIQ